MDPDSIQRIGVVCIPTNCKAKRASNIKKGVNADVRDGSLLKVDVEEYQMYGHGYEQQNWNYASISVM